MRLLPLILFAALLANVHASRTDVQREGGLDRGKALYLAKCAKCHELYKPSDYSDADWQKWMFKMKRKSKLNAADYQLVFDYSETLRARAKAH
jgi:mono/diheme cytochrome c family protein